jgi:hypothetical protein
MKQKTIYIPGGSLSELHRRNAVNRGGKEQGKYAKEVYRTKIIFA